jgi:hypothetical protein
MKGLIGPFRTKLQKYSEPKSELYRASSNPQDLENHGVHSKLTLLAPNAYHSLNGGEKAGGLVTTGSVAIIYDQESHNRQHTTMPVQINNWLIR